MMIKGVPNRVGMIKVLIVECSDAMTGCLRTSVKDRVPRLFGFRKVRSYRTWLQLMCCASLVVHP